MGNNQINLERKDWGGGLQRQFPGPRAEGGTAGERLSDLEAQSGLLASTHTQTNRQKTAKIRKVK